MRLLPSKYLREQYIFGTVIAVRILLMLAPIIIHALSFGTLGPVERDLGFWMIPRYMTLTRRLGSFAASK